jgi:hypothetical protein
MSAEIHKMCIVGEKKAKWVNWGRDKTTNSRSLAVGSRMMQLEDLKGLGDL